MMPVRACSEARLNPLSLAYLGPGLSDHFPNFHPSPFFLKNGCFDFIHSTNQVVHRARGFYKLVLTFLIPYIEGRFKCTVFMVKHTVFMVTVPFLWCYPHVSIPLCLVWYSYHKVGIVDRKGITIGFKIHA